MAPEQATVKLNDETMQMLRDIETTVKDISAFLRKFVQTAENAGLVKLPDD